MPVSDPNLGLAFGLTLAAGAATAIGAAIVFIPRLVRLASRRNLAAALSLSAGVMIYVAFVEILSKSLKYFKMAGQPDNVAYIYATVCFFVGVAIMMILNLVVTALAGKNHHDHDHVCCEEGECTIHQSTVTVENDCQKETEEIVAPSGCHCCSDDPVGDLEKVQRMAEEIETLEDGRATHKEDHSADSSNNGNGMGEEFYDVAQLVEEDPEAQPEAVVQKVTENNDDDNLLNDEKDRQKLLRMSISAGLAIALHNFPEGLATFMSTLADPKVGAVLSIAIAIHNIPEGVVVAMPIYYATGSRWKAFFWGVLSGVAEPIAALLGWAVLASYFSNSLYAALFGIVAGMMVIICIKEWVPAAHRYDPDDTVVTYFFIAGMAIMALSLVLFVV